MRRRPAGRRVGPDRRRRGGGRGSGPNGREEPSPELAAQVVEEYRRLRDGLKTDALRQVLDLRLEGYTREEIAQRLGCADRAVKRKLDVIREAGCRGNRDGRVDADDTGRPSDAAVERIDERATGSRPPGGRGGAADRGVFGPGRGGGPCGAPGRARGPGAGNAA